MWKIPAQRIVRKTGLLLAMTLWLGQTMHCKNSGAATDFVHLLTQMNQAVGQEVKTLLQAKDLKTTMASLESFLTTMETLEKKFIALSEKFPEFNPEQEAATRQLILDFRQNLGQFAELSSQANMKYFANEEFKLLIKKIGTVFN